MVAQSWFRNLWTTTSKKHEIHSHKENIAVLAFEAASLMTKLLHLWQALSDKQVAKLRDELSNSVGVKKLVSENDEEIVRLICAEMTENLLHVAKAVSRLSKKCEDPLLKTFERAFSDLIKIGADVYGWQYSWKKMDGKVKKMERFVVANTNLYQEMEMLADLEQTVKRMKGSDHPDTIAMVEYEKKVARKRQQVKHLKENSLWSRTYDYTILLLARSVFTVFARIGHVFGTNNVACAGAKESRILDSHCNRNSHSSVFLQSSVYPSDNYGNGFSGALRSSISSSGPLSRAKNMAANFHSGPIGNSTITSSPIGGEHNGGGFYSGPLGRSSTKSRPISKVIKSPFNFWRDKSEDAKEKTSQRKRQGITVSRPLIGSCSVVSDGVCTFNRQMDSGIDFKKKVLNPPPETLGAAALALHYANVIILIEKLAASPHLIGNDARNDLYNMLPASIRADLRAKLKPVAKSLTSSVYDTVLATEWNDAISGTLKWLAPLAHNTVRWQSERSFEHQSLVSRMNVLLVQTLYFANQEKTERTITELLIGLNYIWRLGREINAKSLVECAGGRAFEEYLE
ncbi:uncharacterized protein LOC127251258 [Andrographis paniculata]|uniref:uncharacterized protein LOC127251258 n=1 Tax=Andrographis paniculata TaxID=175694 RepID=UPI0021E7BA07|nr:uncharacterized protein LOC127251258 [Andrographis paniculata]XP_051130832.1 uncharacterized protein LOC127251258 [Andrographis paniculata]